MHADHLGGGDRNRTGVQGFAGPRADVPGRPQASETLELQDFRTTAVDREDGRLGGVKESLSLVPPLLRDLPPVPSGGRSRCAGRSRFGQRQNSSIDSARSTRWAT
jgi:hypothetical protein